MEKITDPKFLIENFVFLFGPAAALITARNSYQTWVKYDIFAALVGGIVLILKPDWFLSPIVNNQIYLDLIIKMYIFLF
jgi:hypothetical protein